MHAHMIDTNISNDEKYHNSIFLNIVDKQKYKQYTVVSYNK